MRYILSLLLLCFTLSASSQNSYQLWYDQPSTAWEEALPIGNGRLGAMVFGHVNEERIVLNEGTLWSGLPLESSVNREAARYLPQVRKALADKDYELANRLCKKMQGHYSQSYLPLGDLTIVQTFANNKPRIRNYRRSLDISQAVATTDFRADNVSFHREYIASNPDNAIVAYYTASEPGKLNLSISLSSQLRPKFAAPNDSTIQISGYAPSRVDPNYYHRKDGESIDWGNSPETYGMRYQANVTVRTSDGTVTSDSVGIHVAGATTATIYITSATSFNGNDKHPFLNGRDEKAICLDHLAKASKQSYTEIRTKHITDYQSLFNRVVLTLTDTIGNDAMKKMPTDLRLKAYQYGTYDPTLEQLFFDFGRYLLISSSRTDAPANLQGIWNPHMRAPWSSNYTININTQMNYWLAEPANLSETHLPLLNWIQTLPRNGQHTAREFYGLKGWTAHHNSDIWGLTNPVGDCGDGDPQWANWYMGGAWLCQHLWEHYAFTLDTRYLRTVYPTMKQSAEFCMGWLVEKTLSNGKTYLITSPSTSPENRFIHNGHSYSVCEGTTMDIAIIRDLLTNTIAAANALGTDKGFCKKMQNTINRLAPFQIGKKGQLQEWAEDYDEEDPHHRHISHLFALHPGKQISPINTPELARAADRTFTIRGDEGTGWSKAWKINFAARLHDGNHAYKMLRETMHYVDPHDPSHGGTFPNLFDAHPPFQIDGNFGASAGIIEMLLQSHLGEIHLLPALPSAWSAGSISGLKARGNYTVDIVWNHSTLTSATLHSHQGGNVTLRTSVPISVKGTACTSAANGSYFLTTFHTQPNSEYRIERQTNNL